MSLLFLWQQQACCIVLKELLMLLLLVLQALSAAADLQLCSFAACGTCSQFKSQQHVGLCSPSLSFGLSATTGTVATATLRDCEF